MNNQDKVHGNTSSHKSLVNPSLQIFYKTRPKIDDYTWEQITKEVYLPIWNRVEINFATSVKNQLKERYEIP